MQRASIQFKFLDAKANEGRATFTGLGSVFGNEDLGGDVIEPGAFSESLKTRTPKMLIQHGYGQHGVTPVGKWTKVTETDTALAVEGELFLESDEIRLAYRGLKEGVLDGLSIGYLPKRWEWDKRGDRSVRVLKEVDTYEISLVTWPMNEAARVQDVKSRLTNGETVSKRDLEALLRDAGLSREHAKAIVAEGWQGLKQRDAGEDLEQQLLNLRRSISNA